LRHKKLSIGLGAVAALFAATLFATNAWAATQERVLYSFNPMPDGAQPYAGLISDAAGNLYGTTYSGGTYGVGTVFELTVQRRHGRVGTTWTRKVLHSFKNGTGTGGAYPYGGLVIDAAGNLYGTTYYGGAYSVGAVFELTPQAGSGWTETLLYSFNQNGTDGYNPYAGLIFDVAGNLYGTTVLGGTYNNGTVFELTPQTGGGWTEQVLHSFNNNGVDGAYPYGGLIFDAAGDLYGIANKGGTYGGGTVFELTPQAGGGWTEAVLHHFGNGTDGAAGSLGRLIFDKNGNLYGTTNKGGANGDGTVFQLMPQAGGGWTENVLYSFNPNNGTDGINPCAGLIIDAAGNLYSTTSRGGTYGGGTVFELMPQSGGGWTEKVLHGFGYGTEGTGSFAGLVFDQNGYIYGTTTSGTGAYLQGTVFELTPLGAPGYWGATVLYGFGNGTDGGYPYGGLISDAAGNLYGTTYLVGAHGVGTVFELMPQAGGGWTEKMLYSFNNAPADGNYPYAGLIFDAAGNLYGTTVQGGTYNDGTVFELMPQAGGGWTEKMLYSFSNAPADGNYPYAGLIFDASGNLYGTTVGGGTYNYGTVFELMPQAGGGWAETVLHSFNQNGTDGYNPYAGLIFDAAGNLYGTTEGGGSYGGGTVFELTPQAGGGWTENVLYSFGSGSDGQYADTGLIIDLAGNLYGTTRFGGTYGHGTVFELTPQAGGGWTEKVLYSLNPNSPTDGLYPYAGLIIDAGGNLYGTTRLGGANGRGTVFELTPQSGGGWTEKVLYSFDPGNGNGTDGIYPYASLIMDAGGNLYGTTRFGGTYEWGTVFEITP
jgi:uncharacterized repeat protein (TIGR03803 family)